MSFKKYHFFMYIFLLFVSLFAEHYDDYNPDDWVSFRNFRFVKNIDADSRNAYVVTTKGVIVFDIWRKEWVETITTSDGLFSNSIYSLNADTNSNGFCVRTSKGTSYYNTFAKSWDPYLKIDTDKNVAKNTDISNLFIASPYFFDGTAIKDASFTAYNISVVKEIKKSQNFVLGTWGLGTFYGNLRIKKAKAFPIGLFNESVNCIASKKEFVWFGSKDGSLTRYNMRTNQWKHYYYPVIASLNKGRINSLFLDKTYLWVGTQNGLVKFNTSKNSWSNCSILDDKYITAITGTGKSLLIIGTDVGLCSIDLSSFTLKWHLNNKINGMHVTCLWVDGDDIWVGTKKGLYRVYISEKGEFLWRKISGYHLINDREILSIYSKNSRLFIGTSNGLVMALYSDNNVSFLDELYALTTGFKVENICNTDSLTWIGTKNGVFQFDKNFNKRNLYTTDDGLVSNGITASLRVNDVIWFCTNKGVTACKWKNVCKRKSF